MKKKLKIALISCCSDKGFALPIAIGLGLIMLLIGTTMIMRSQGDQTIASAQKATNRGLSAAETGITRYQSLINSNRVIAMYSRTSTPGWTTASAIPGITDTCSGNVNGASAVTAAATTDWRDIDSSDSSKGQYRLVDYSYAPTTGVAPGTAPGTGTLTVEGRVNQAGIGAATTRLQASIRVTKQPLSGSIPGLWIKNVTQNMGSNKVNGNILVSGCALPAGVSQSNVTSGYAAVPSPYAPIPDTPSLPTSNFNLANPGDIWTTLPRSSDINADGTAYVSGTTLTSSSPTYHYVINGDLDKNGATISLQPNAKIVFYVKGKITLGGSSTINSSGNPYQMQIYGNTFLRDAAGNLTGGTKYGCVAGASCPTEIVKINGTPTISALIHAPDGVGSVSGGSGGCDANSNPVNGFVGALWFKQWDSSSSPSGAVVCAKGDYGSFLATQNNAPPSISSITGWQRQEIP